MRELFGPFSKADQHYRAELIAEGHSRIITPILPLTYAVLGMAMLLSGGFSRRGQTGRVLTAILVMTGILVSSFALQNLAVKHPALILPMYANALVDRKVVVSGKRLSVLVDLGGRRIYN